MSAPGTRPPEDTGSAVPPYEGRKESASSDDETTKDGARTGGAAAPTTGTGMKSPEPADTAGGATTSPADEKPAEEMPETEPDEGGTTGPAHTPGTDRAEDKPS